MSRNFQNYEWVWRAERKANPPALPSCAFCQTSHHPIDSCPALPAKFCRACGGRGSLDHGYIVSEPCPVCTPSDEEYRAYLDKEEARESYLESLTNDERAA